MVSQHMNNRPCGRLKAQWFDQWHPLLDDALATLPEMEDCPGGLYRDIFCNPGPREKRVVLLTDGNGPVAVVALRRRGVAWELMTNWILPGEAFPVQSGGKMAALEGLRANVHSAGWRSDESPPQGRWVRQLQVMPTYKMPCSDNFEQYWRKAGHWNTVRRTRKRTQDFSMQVNAPGTAEWTIRNWEKTWRIKEDVESSTLADRLLAANRLEQEGRHLTFCLFKDEQAVAGHTFVVHRGDIVCQVSHRDMDYDYHGVGTRLMDMIFYWAADQGYQHIDLGGGHDYKERWAPVAGNKYEFQVCPPGQYYMTKVARMPHRFKARAGDVFRRVMKAEVRRTATGGETQ